MFASATLRWYARALCNCESLPYQTSYGRSPGRPSATMFAWTDTSTI